MSKKKSRKILALILSVMLIVSTIPTSVLATDTSTELITEEIALREENVKHFKMPDGSYTAVVYSEPVHRIDSNGEWQDIDNRMKESTVKNKQAYITDDGRAVFSKKVDKTNSTIFELVDNGYSIKVSVVDDNIQNTTAKLSNHAKKYIPTSADDFEEQYKKLKTIDNNTTVSYKNLLKGITFEYVLSSNDVKENIIIDKKFDKYEYTFVYELSGLLALLNDDGSINLIDEITKNFVYTIPAPYMYDAEGEISYDVSYELEELEKGIYSLIVSADETWINDSERVFPVVIDPTVTFTAGYYDTYINSADPSANYGSSSELWISSTKTPFMKYNFLPTLPADATISNAKLNLYYYYNVSTGSLNAGLYLVGVNWNESTWTWNTANRNASLGILPTRLATVSLPASSSITSSTPGIATISITELVQAWYAGTSNYGIALKYESGTNGSVILKAWESGSATRANYEVSYIISSLPIKNGTYFLNNFQYGNYVQMDNNQSISSEGAILELWDYDGSSAQKWNFVYLHNGYYKITSLASGKAITAPLEADESLVQKTYIADSNQMWVVSNLGSGMYRFKPKSNTTHYMASGEGVFTSDGRNVEMCSIQADGQDEWLIIESKDLSLIAIPDNRDRTSFFNSVINEMASIGYIDCYENQNFLDRGTTDGELVGRMANSKISVIRTHGTQTSITTSNGSLTKGKIEGMPAGFLGYSELIIYGACKTGLGRETGNNLVNATREQGSEIVIGFEKEVWHTEVNYWCDIFFRKLADGCTVLEACIVADQHVADNWYNSDSPEFDIRTDSWYIAGNSIATFS